MAIDFPSSPTAGQVYTYNGVTYVYSAQGVWVTASASAVGIIGGLPQGRLTLQSLTPVMTTTQAAKTTIYYTPYIGNKVPIYDGTNMVMTTFNELSVATTDTTKSPAAIGVSKVNDWFVWSDAGTIRIGHGPDWTSDTVRSAGTALVMVNGILLNNAAITNGPAAQRGTYVGTTRSNASSQLDFIYPDISAGTTPGFFGVWNCYNRVLIGGVGGDSTATWTHAATTIRQKRGSAGNQISFVSGLAEDIAVMFISQRGAAAGDGTVPIIGVGVDTITAFTGPTGQTASASAMTSTAMAGYKAPSFGHHVWSANEATNGTGTATFYGAMTTPTQQANSHQFQFLM